MAPRRTALAADTDVTFVKHKRAWGWFSFVFLLGALIPPLAVAARFGIGRDFWINVPLTLAGYIPGHVHNFYIQTIRNNKTHARTPKWAIRYGLVDTTKIERNKKRSEWKSKYDGRNPPEDYERQEVEEGQIPDPPPLPDGANAATTKGSKLWKPEDEGYYAEDGRSPRSKAGSTISRDSGASSGGGRWHYSANTAEDSPSLNRHLKKSSGKKDRFARSEDVMAVGVAKKKKKSTSKSKVLDGPEDPVGRHGTGEIHESSLIGAPESTLDHQF